MVDTFWRIFFEDYIFSKNFHLDFIKIMVKRIENSLYFESIHRYKNFGTYHEGLAANQHESIRKASKRFVEKGGRLFYEDKKRGRQRLALESQEERESALRESHDDSNHYGEKKTLNRLESAYYWQSMVNDVRNWIKVCDRCQKMEKIKTVSKKLNPIVTEEPWQIIGIDLMGPYTLTEDGNRYIFTATDLFSKFVFAKPIVNKTAEEVSSVVEELFYTYGPPKKIITDQGREFVNKTTEALFKRWGVHQSITAPYSPEGNGQDERTNGNIKTILSKYLNDQQNDWDKYVRQIVYGINTSYQETIKRTPFMVMFRREISPPMYMNVINDINFRETVGELEEAKENSTTLYSNNPDDRGDHTYSLISKSCERQNSEMEEVNTPFFKEVRETIAVAQAKQKKDYAARNTSKCKSFDFECGQEVLRRNSKKDGRKGGKLEDDWLGPYKVERIFPNGHVLLSQNGVALKNKYKLKHLKPYMRKISADDDDCEIVGAMISPHKNRVKPKSCERPRETDKHPGFFHTISNGGWLEDSHMNFAGSLLTEQFPHVIIQPTTVIAAGTGGALVGTPEGQFVQPVNINRNHWICLTNINCPQGTVRIFDSMKPSVLDDDLKQAISWLLFFQGPWITVQWAKMCQQEGGSDCGLFCIAVATSLCYGQEPSNLDYNQCQMRAHLVDCLLRRKLRPFPATQQSFCLNVHVKECSFKIICICRQPIISNAPVIVCHLCREKYHIKCLTANVENVEGFICDSCNPFSV